MEHRLCSIVRSCLPIAHLKRKIFSKYCWSLYIWRAREKNWKSHILNIPRYRQFLIPRKQNNEGIFRHLFFINLLAIVFKTFQPLYSAPQIYSSWQWLNNVAIFVIHTCIYFFLLTPAPRYMLQCVYLKIEIPASVNCSKTSSKFSPSTRLKPKSANFRIPGPSNKT